MAKNNKNFISMIVNNMDVLAAIGVLGIIAMIILPISTGLLDLLLTFNITFSIIIILFNIVYNGDITIFYFPYLTFSYHVI